jgi:5'-nucleotidase/UDP-sugar diphosphatase
MKKTTTILSVLLVVAVIVAGVFISQKNTVASEKDELSKQVESLNTQLESLTEQDKTSKGRSPKSPAQKALDDAQKALDDAQKELEQLKKADEENAAAISAAKEEKTKLEAEIEQLKAKAKELETAKKDAEEALNKSQSELKALQEEKASLQEKLDASEAETKELKEKIAELEAAKKTTEDALSAVPDELKALQEEKDSLQEKLAASEAETKELSDKLAELEAAKKDAEEALNKSQSELKALQEEKASLEEKLAASDTDAKELEDKLAELETAKKAAEESLNKSQSDLKALQDEKASLQEKLAASDAGTKELQDKLALLETSKKETSSVVILHTNDVHARVEGDDKSQIGYPRLISIAKELRKDNEVILLDAGDVLHGTAFANLTQGESIVDLMNLAGYSALAPGNHDFNYGYDRLMELEKKMDFPLVNANIYIDGEHAFAPYAIVQAGTKNIAVIGAANPQMQSAIHPDRIKGLEFKDYETIEKTVEEIKPQVDAVIILAHWGANDAYDPNSSILAKIPGVDLVVDGHSHTPLEEIKQTENAALVVSAGEHMKHIGRVIMDFTENGVICKADSISFEEAQNYAPDEEAVQLIQKLKAEQQELLSVVIGKTNVSLDGERETNRTGETNLGNLATDALIWYSKADFAFTNGGGIRTSIPKGDITQGDIIEVFPFGNSVVVIEATGEQILAAMEHGISLYPETNGGFPQISGGKIVYNPENPAGERIVEMEIQGKPVEKDKKYTVVTNDFTAAGGDGYEMLKDCPVLRYQGTLDEAFIEYIKEIGVVDIGIEGRIVQAEQPEADVQDDKEAQETVTVL